MCRYPAVHSSFPQFADIRYVPLSRSIIPHTLFWHTDNFHNPTHSSRSDQREIVFTSLKWRNVDSVESTMLVGAVTLQSIDSEA